MPAATAAAEPPTRDRPELALVLVQATDTGVEGEATAPTWVFPVDAPAAPSAGDSQALAVNTQDGSTLYDVAFALVWADDDGLARNEAYAFASCTACTTVAVGFQVVFVIGQVDVVVPQNISGALNYSCVQCVTYALASQLVLPLPDGLSADATAELEALWAQIMSFAQDLDDVPLAELRARLEDYKAAVLSVVEQDVARSTSGVSEDDGVAPASSVSPRATGAPAPTSPSSTTSTSSSTPGATSSPAPTTASPSPSTSSSPSESSTPSPATSGG